MNRSKHTPGPWSVDRHGDVARNEMRIARVCRSSENSAGGPIVDMPQEANANLIAAAPWLLESVKFLVEFCGLSQHDKSDPKIAQIYAALAKAEGK